MFVNVIKLFEFEDNNKTYLVYVKDNTLMFGYYKDFEILNDLSLEELKNIKNIYTLLVGNKNDLIKLSSSKINNSLITFFYNPNNHLYSFYENKDEKLVKPDSNLIKKLNYLYNHHEGVLYSKEKKYAKEEFYKIILKKGTKYITVSVTAGLILSYLPAMPGNNTLFKIDYSLDNLYKDPNIIYDNSSYSFSDVKTSIDSNPNLTDEEKEFLYGLEDEINENINYIDIKKLCSNMHNLTINYNSENKLANNKKDVLIDYNIAGSYTYMGINKGNIDLYDNLFNHTTCFTDSDKTTLIHEVNHVVNNKSPLLSIPGIQGNVVGSTYAVFDVETNIMHEMVNELFSREYANGFNVDDTFNGYNDLMPVMYALAEIIDEDTLRRYKYNSDDYYLNNYFKSIGVEDYYIYSLYKDLNLVYSNTLNNDEIALNKQEIYNIICYMYEKKYNMNMENDLVMLSYFYKTDYTSHDSDLKFEQIIGSDSIFVIENKGYFSKKYIDKHPNIKIYEYDDISDNCLRQVYTINDSNRYINNKIK